MEVVNSKVEELKVLIDSATDRVKESSVHCLQKLLHHLVTFFSSQRFACVSFVVVDTKTGKEQRFYTFRELLDHSKYLLSQKEQHKNLQSNQYLERALGNRQTANQTDARTCEANQFHVSSGDHAASHAATVSQATASHNTVSHARLPVHSYANQRHGDSQQQQQQQHQQYAVSSVPCPQTRGGYLEPSHAPLDHTLDHALDSSQRSLSVSDYPRHVPPVAHRHRERDSACNFQKDNTDYDIHNLLACNDSPVVAASSHQHQHQGYLNHQYNNCANGATQIPDNQNSLNVVNRDHAQQSHEQQTFANCQVRSTVGQYVASAHDVIHCTMAPLQSQGNSLNSVLSSGLSGRREELGVISTESNSIHLGSNSVSREVQCHNAEVYQQRPSETLQLDSRPMQGFASSLDSDSLFSTDKSMADVDGANSRVLLRDMIDSDVVSGKARSSWPVSQKSQPVHQKQIEDSSFLTSPPLAERQPLTVAEPRHSYVPVQQMYTNNSESLDLTGPSKSNSDLTTIPEVVVRRSLSRMTAAPMEQRATGSPLLSLRSTWSSLGKGGSSDGRCNITEQPEFVSQTSNSPLSFGANHMDKDKALNALLARKLTEVRSSPEESRTVSASAAASSNARPCKTSMRNLPVGNAKKNGRSPNRSPNLRNSRRLASRRKSSSPHKVVSNELEQTTSEVAASYAGAGDSGSEPDNDPVVEIVITSDSGEEQDMECDNSGDSEKLKGDSDDPRMKYYCYYCKETDQRMTLSELLRHLKENHMKEDSKKTGLPCPQCCKLYKHKEQGTDGLYSTMLACLNHMMCHHSCQVPNYMQVYKCQQCSFVSLIKNLVKRHEATHYASQDPESQCNDCGKSVKKQSEKGHRVHCPAAVASAEKSPKEEHKCGFCQKEYSSKSALAIHIERKHKNVNSFLCSKCPSSFFAKVDLERHMYAQHSVNISKRSVTKCPYCNYQSLEGSLMRKHIKNHQTGSFVCDICSKEFGTENRLKSHRMIHTAERKYKCEDCEYATAKRYHFERHVAVRHKGQFWKCTECSMLSFNKNNLQKHINKAHQGNAEIEEVKNLSKDSGNKSTKKKKGSSSQNNNTSTAPVPFSSTFDADTDIGPAPNLNLQEQNDQGQNGPEKLDSTLGLLLEQTNTARNFWPP